MKALFNTYPMAFDVPGGGEMQLLAYHRHLPQFGITPTLFDLWNPRFDDYDLVHFFSVVGGSVHFCGHVKRRGMPLVISSSLWITPETRDLYPYREILDQLSLADRVIVNSRAEGDQLAGVFGLPRERFATVYNGVEEDFLAPVDPELFRRRFGISGPFLLNIGNVEPRKNQLGLARAVRRFPGLQVVVVGRVRDSDYARASLQEAPGQLVHVGAIEHTSELLRSAIAACDGFVLPSTLETPGLAALEAAAQGRRLMVTAVGAAREYFGDLAVYVDPVSTDSIAEGIEALRARSLFSPALAERVRTRFTWPVVLGALASEYRSLCPGAKDH